MVALKNFFEIDGKPVYLVGINYQSAEWGHITDLWEKDDELPAVVDRDFELMKRMGILAIRIQSAVFHRKKTFDNVLSYARTWGIYVMPNLGIGDLMRGAEGRWFKSQGGDMVAMPGEDRPGPRFAHERPDPFDEKGIANAREYLKGLLGHYKDEPMILAWDIANEPTYSLYGMSALKYAQYCGKDSRTAREITSRWTREICRAAKEADPNHPITVGTDHSIVFMDVGFDAYDFSEVNDLMTTHHYSRSVSGFVMLDEACSLRDTYMPSFVAVFSRVTGKPFASGECGNNSYVMSEEKQARHYRVMLHSGLVNGAIGAFPWCLHAYDWSVPRIHEGYAGAPAESEFGIVRPDHTLKPAGEELAAFARRVGRIDFSEYGLEAPTAALLLPESYYDFLYEHRASLFNAFVLAKEAHLSLKILRASAGLEAYKMLIVPTTHLSVKEMDIIKAFVEKGGSLLLSVTEALSGRVSYLKEVVGFTNQDYILLPREVEVEFEQSFGSLGRGSVLRYESDTLGWYVSHEKPENERQYFTVVQPATAAVLARDAAGRPAILLNKFGAGNVLSFTFPAEYCLGHMIDAYETDRTWRVYEGLANLAEGTSGSAAFPRGVRCDNPMVELGVLRGRVDSLVFVINHSHKQQAVTLSFDPKPARIADFDTGKTLALARGATSFRIKLPENGVSVIRVMDLKGADR